MFQHVVWGFGSKEAFGHDSTHQPNRPGAAELQIQDELPAPGLGGDLDIDRCQMPYSSKAASFIDAFRMKGSPHFINVGAFVH